MVSPQLPVDDVETDVIHGDGVWYLFGVEDSEEIYHDWIQTDFIVFTEAYR